MLSLKVAILNSKQALEAVNVVHWMICDCPAYLIVCVLITLSQAHMA